MARNGRRLHGEHPGFTFCHGRLESSLSEHTVTDSVFRKIIPEMSEMSVWGRVTLSELQALVRSGMIARGKREGCWAVGFGGHPSGRK